MIEVVAFDADDTLWHSESLFQETQRRLAEILDRYAPHEEVEARLGETERRNISLFGYGVKGFTLSMVEAAIEISRQQVSAAELHEIVMLGKQMLDSPLELLPDVADTLAELAGRHRLLLITKGDLLDQRNKIERSGLAERFEAVEVVSEKDRAAYDRVFTRYRAVPATTVMVGNSIPSDVLPVLEIGAYAIYIPYGVIASFERHEREPDHPRFRRLEQIAGLPDLLQQLAGAPAG